ncbi:ribonuclease Z [Planococcus lenghuensis]|uniref:Ribonuclease Z n=1 Tax=Planococcus lenghuensis TaxID=2213202 RepID=A0A1Q2KXX3_9BACL|nr:ribonuclease Z [Planococcus lenghuensis]AQQ53051.1 ribonuclease Z [Planococcus lenghuensis]
MQLLFLGTGGGMPSKERNTSALAMKLLEERGAVWLFDCGEATQHQILRTTLKPRKIEKIFITHMHGDHIFGLPGLLGSRSFLGGSEPLTLYGPKGLEEWVLATLRLSRTHLSYPLEFVEAEDGVVFEDDMFSVEAHLLEHVIPCYGYRIRQKPLPPVLLAEKARELGVPKGPLLGRLKNGEDVTLENGVIIRSAEVTAPGKDGFTVAILGDTRYTEAAVKLARNADVLVHEGTFDQTTADLARDYGHSTVKEAAETARQAGAKALIINHLSARFLPSDHRELLGEAGSVFNPVYIAEDFREFYWNKDRLLPDE